MTSPSPPPLTGDAVDARPPLPREQLAVLFVDVVESVRLMDRHEEALVVAWQALVGRIEAGLLAPFGGRLVKSHGDGALMAFASPHGAVMAAAALNRASGEISAGMPPGVALRLRAGLHYGDVIVDRLDLYGRGVNLAARLQALAGPGEICLSEAARDGVHMGWA